jgi:hypothetical protein
MNCRLVRAAQMCALTLAVSCRLPSASVRPISSSPAGIGCSGSSCGAARDSLVTVTYLGVSGLLIQHAGHVMLTAPFFSDPEFSKVRPRVRRLLRRNTPISADTNAINALLPRAARNASVILVGHGHYDHLMDVPFIATRHATSAIVYGSPTVRHILMGDTALRSHPGRVVAIDTTDAGTVDGEGRWIYSADSAFRFMALVASHAPAFNLGAFKYRFASGVVAADLDSLPHTAPEWKLGEPYAFIIDVLAGNIPVYRIYFQDAPSQPPLGFPPLSVLARRGIDLAVLCAATSSNVTYAPDSLLAVIKPREVLVTHWESFFRSQGAPVRVGAGTNLHEFVRSLRRSGIKSWVIPLPQTEFRFRENPPLEKRSAQAPG